MSEKEKFSFCSVEIRLFRYCYANRLNGNCNMLPLVEKKRTHDSWKTINTSRLSQLTILNADIFLSLFCSLSLLPPSPIACKQFNLFIYLIFSQFCGEYSSIYFLIFHLIFSRPMSFVHSKMKKNGHLRKLLFIYYVNNNLCRIFTIKMNNCLFVASIWSE